MNPIETILKSDDELIRECDVHTYKASGPGGQHRNKVSSAVRVVHQPSGVTAHGNDSRSQHENRKLALKRLRMNIACEIRRDGSIYDGKIPAIVSECIFSPKGAAKDRRKLEVGRKDHRFWAVASFVLDIFNACNAALGDTAKYIGISTGNLISFIKTDRHLFTAAQKLRREHNQKPLK